MVAVGARDIQLGAGVDGKGPVLEEPHVRSVDDGTGVDLNGTARPVARHAEGSDGGLRIGEGEAPDAVIDGQAAQVNRIVQEGYTGTVTAGSLVQLHGSCIVNVAGDIQVEVFTAAEGD